MKIIETSFRDGQQSLAATRMKTDDILSVIENFDSVGFYALEVWGGATFDSCLRYLNEDPWERLRKIRKLIKTTKLQMLLRGRNLLGYHHYDDEVVDLFIKKSIENGIDIIRIFDALNDLDNIKSSLFSTKKYGAHAQVAFSYTVSPYHNNDYYVNLAIKAEELGADSICIKDMAGLLLPNTAYNLIAKLKESIKIPISLHSHDTSGIISSTYLKAAEAGVDMLDTSFSPFSGGTSQPSTEGICMMLENLGVRTNVKLEILKKSLVKMEMLRTKMIDEGNYKIESLFSHPHIFTSQVPGGMYSNLISQLKEQGLLHRLNEVLEEIPKVRKDFGYPPLVTPISQIIGVQATLNVMSGIRYNMLTSEIISLAKGKYGNSISPIKKEILEKINNKEKNNHEDRLNLDIIRARYSKTNFNDEEFLAILMFKDIAESFYLKKWAENNKYQLENGFMLKQNYFKYKFDMNNKKDEINIDIASPFKGYIVNIFIKEGDHILIGEPLLLISVKHLFIEITSPSNGEVVSVNISEEDAVNTNTQLLKIKKF